MRLLYAMFGWGVVLLGAVHMMATFFIFKTLTNSALWFFSAGIAMALTGALNLLNRAYGQNALWLRRICVAANITMLAFGIVAGIVSRASVAELVFVLGLTGGATALSLSGPRVLRAP